MAKKKKKRTGMTGKRNSGVTPQRKINWVIWSILFVAIIISVYFVYPRSEKDSTRDDYERDLVREAGIEFTKQGELAFIDEAGDTLRKIDIEIAEDDVKRQFGLMLRENMTEDQGMLFIFPTEQILSFWMKNTVISLDMLFVNADYKIVTIAKNTVPYSTNNHSSSEPAKYVVEVLAGFTDKYDITVGDRISYKRTVEVEENGEEN